MNESMDKSRLRLRTECYTIGDRTDIQRSELSCSAEAVPLKWVIACNSRPFVNPFREKGTLHSRRISVHKHWRGDANAAVNASHGVGTLCAV